MATFRLKRYSFLDTYGSLDKMQEIYNSGTLTGGKQEKLLNEINYLKGSTQTKNVPAVISPTPKPPVTPPKPSVGGNWMSKTWNSGWKGKAGLIAGGATLLGGSILAGKSLFGNKEQQ